MGKHEKNAASNDIVTGRIALCVAYKGTNYFGWQSQTSGVPSIQQKVEDAISRVANHPVEVVCAGRTDKAVHASYQVVHFDTRAERTERSWVFGCNANLPPDISVSWARSVDEEFHARFSAISRRYNYFIFNHPIRPAHFSDQVTWIHYPLDENVMHNAAQCLLGEHDFSSFRAAGCQSKSPFRRIDHISVRRVRDMVLLDVGGNAFLHHMVRNIAGVLIRIGTGEKPAAWCREVLEARDRTKAAVTAPPFGLYLCDVAYPESFDLPKSEGPPAFAQLMLAALGNEQIISHDLWAISRLDKSS
jgi:tRNA pseudouridine38-40 synthase